MATEDARFVSPLDLLLFMRANVAMRAVPASDLVQMASAARERNVRAGEYIIEPGSPVDHAYLVVDGRVEIDAETYREAIDAPTSLNWLRLHGGFETSHAVVALEDTLVFELDARLILEQLERNPALREYMLRAYARRVLELRSDLPVHPDDAKVPDPGVPPDSALSLVERLKEIAGPGAFWENANLDAIVTVAREMTELHIPAGEELWELDRQSPYTFNIVSGIVECANSEGERVRVGAGFTLGFYQALADVPPAFSAVAVQDVVTLRSDIAETLAVLEHHSAMAMGLLRGVSRHFAAAYEADRVRGDQPAAPSEVNLRSQA